MKKFLMLVMVFLPFMLFFTGYTVAYFFLNKPSIVVPNVLGKTVCDAALILSQQSLFLSILKEQEDVLMPDGTIISQLPFPGQRCKFQKPVHVTVVKKMTTKKTPAFFGLRREEIEELAKKTKLRVSIVAIPVLYTRGVCFAQSPMSGEVVTGDSIIVYLAEERERSYMMPDVCGLVYDDVVALLSKAGISYEVAHVRDEGELLLPVHKIIDQAPSPGTLVRGDNGLHMKLYLD